MPLDIMFTKGFEGFKHVSSEFMKKKLKITHTCNVIFGT